MEQRLLELCAGRSVEKLGGAVEAELGARDGSKGGRLPSDPVLKFRMLVLQAMHGLSLAQTERPTADWLSWMRFCGSGDAVPGANTL